MTTFCLHVRILKITNVSIASQSQAYSCQSLEDLYLKTNIPPSRIVAKRSHMSQPSKILPECFSLEPWLERWSNGLQALNSLRKVKKDLIHWRGNDPVLEVHAPTHRIATTTTTQSMDTVGARDTFFRNS